MNHSKSTRFLAMLLAVVMVIGFMPVTSFAAEATDESATPVTATVKFDVNGGIGEYEDQVVTVGEKVLKPEQDPTYEGFEFAYWTADLEADVEWDFEEDVVTEDMTLFAAWIAAAEESGDDETAIEGGDDEAATEGGDDEAATEGGDDETATEGGDDETATEGGDDETATEGGDDEATTEGGDDEAATEGGDDETAIEGGDEDEVQPVAYTVNHYKWDWDLEADVLIESEELSGIPGQMTNAQAKEYEGLMLMDDIVQLEIAADGSTVVDVFYIVELDSSLFLPSKLFDTSVTGEYFKVLEEKVYDLAPGAQEYGFTLNNAEGKDRKLVHVFAVDTKNPDIEVMPGYWAIDTLDPDNLKLEGDAALSGWKAMELSKTVAYYEGMGYNVVGAMNTALAYDSNAPYGYMVWNGVVLGTPEIHKGAQTYLAIDWNGNCELRSMSTPLTGNEKTAISANFGWLVKDGVLSSKTVERTTSDASRSMIGIKADGTLIFCHVDGRQGDYVSGGLSNYEMGEIMLALGCVNAVNCDGGGSSTFISKRVGETENTMRSMPSDGAERPTINSVILVSKAGASGIFDKVKFSSEYDYIAPGASMVLSAEGLDTKQFLMEIPAGVTYQVAEEGMGTIENGVYTAGATVGAVTIQAVYNDAVVGELVLNVVHPDSFAFTAETTALPMDKTLELEVVAKYGEDDWNVCIDGAYTLSLPAEDYGSSLDGNVMSPPSDPEHEMKSVIVTATYNADKTKNDTISVMFGEASKLLFDFEDGEHTYFLGVDEMYDWAKETGASAPIQGDGNYSENTDSEVFLSTRENGGQVRNGDHALGVTLDYTDASFAGWSYNMFFYTGEPIVLRDTANGQNATRFGGWVYIPEGAAGLAMQLGLYTKGTTGALGYTQLNFQVTTVKGERKNLNAITEADIPESRWVYAYADLTGKDYYSLPDPMGEISREPSFMRYYIKPMAPAKLTFYFDDFALDYSTAVEDRVLPTISNVSYAVQDTASALDNGAVVNASTLSFTATVADDQALNAGSGKIFVDGIEVATTVSGKNMSSSAVTLTSGTHTVTFEIQDRLGNLARVTRTFAVSGDAAFKLSGHNDSGALAEYGSTYYIDLKVADIASLNGITTTLKLQSANTWEPIGITAAPGFKVTSQYVNKYSNELTITVAREGDAVAVAEGESVLVSIPVRVWSWDGVDHVTDTPILPQEQFATGYCPIVTIDCEVVYGNAAYANNAFGAFGGTYSVETNLKDNTQPWHYHGELTTLNKDATCTEAGYTGRGYCETCKSVVVWGTILPAKGHDYKVEDDQLVCGCGAVLGGNGLVTVGDKIYCLIADHLVTGWQAVENKWVYAAVSTKEVQTGTYTVNKLTYTADEDGYVIKGAWVTDANGTKYSFGPQFHKREWVEIEGKTYYFGTDQYIYTGVRYIEVNRNNPKEGVIWYEFAEDGAYIGKINGFVDHNGLKYYVEEGRYTYGGLMQIDGDYYYARTSGEIVCGKTYWITKNNDLLPVGNYTFDAEGKMIDPPVTEPEQPDPDQPDAPDEPEVKNGIVEEDGKLWWYVDGVKTYAGLMKIDNDYYYARSSGEILTNRTYWITKHNDLLPAANYTFGADGKMLNAPVTEEPDPEPDTPVVPEPPVEPEKNGIVSEGGKLWWYVDGVKTYGGLMKIGDDYYYARSSGEILTNRTYWITKHNDLLPAANYTFGADGKMLNAPVTEEPDPEPDTPVVPEPPVEPEKKNGIVEEGGKLWWYVDDVKTYGGLMYLDTDGDGVKDAYYYARTSGQILTNTKYWITKTNDLLPAANYTFGVDGKMVNPPIA